MMTLVKLSLASWNRFLSRNLSIHPDLLGATHEFTHEQYRIAIALPSSKHLSRESNRGELLTYNHYAEVEGKKVPLQYWVHAVDVTASIPTRVSVPKEILDRPPNAFEIVSEKQQEQLNGLAATHVIVAEKAFDLWLRTLRWKCDNSAIGRPEIMSFQSGWSTCLITEPSAQRIWIAPAILRAKGSKMLTPAVWEEVRCSLMSGDTPPIYIDLIMDATEHIKLGDCQRAVVDMAIACESFLRTLLVKSFPPGLPNSIATYIDDANIRPILDKFVMEIIDSTQQKELNRIRGKLHDLFDSRNKIVHKGTVATATVGKCSEYLEAAKKLLTIRP